MPNLISKKEHLNINEYNSPPTRQIDVHAEHAAQFVVYPSCEDEEKIMSQIIDENDLLLSIFSEIDSLKRTSVFSLQLLPKLKMLLPFDDIYMTTTAGNRGYQQLIFQSFEAERECHPDFSSLFSQNKYFDNDFLNDVIKKDGTAIFSPGIFCKIDKYHRYGVFFNDTNIKELIAVRLKLNEVVLGTIYFTSILVGQFSPRHLKILKAISTHLSFVILNDQTCNVAEAVFVKEHASQQYRDRSGILLVPNKLTPKDIQRRRLLKVGKDLVAVQTKADLFHVIENGLKEIIGFNHAIVLKLSDNKKWLEVFLKDSGTSGLHTNTHYEMMSGRFAVSCKFISGIFQHEGPYIFKPDELVDVESPSFLRMNFERGLRVALAIALWAGNSNAGLMVFFGEDEYSFRPTTLDMLSALTSQLSAAFVNIIASEKIARQAMEISGYKKQLEFQNIYVREELESSNKYEELIGESTSLKKVFNLISRVSDTNSSVLILGETGTGKELIARAIHHASSRKDRSMVKVNCAALPANLIESELFGHERGSFTGAIETRIGKFELANNTTLFLDEIGELPLELQSKLLRAIQEREFERVGGRGTIKTNVRILAATNRDLEQEVFEGRFRADLFYRLNVVPILVPPLRERIEDVPILVSHFLSKQVKKTGRNILGFSSEVMDQLTSYNWPGNIRELEHLVERSVLMANQSFINDINLPGKSNIKEIQTGPMENSIKPLEEVEKAHILGVLKYCNWKVRGNGGAAELLRLPTSTLNSKIKRLGLKK